ncbi:glycosyltransferase family 4 protein [Plantactinospora sp. GCM10030261]|uniref:glycosyltransferase family 4 protein n=1 Tax=Plantactinospora sp. GCM10030261 TaxID=3273420 RepID=UPI00361EC0FD
MRLGLLTQWFAPEPGPASLPAVLARELGRRGHDVRVVTGFPNYPTGRVMPGYRLSRRMDEVVDGVHIRRVALYPSHDASAIRRLTTYGTFAVSAVASGMDALHGLDALWVSNSPITTALPAWWARFVHRIPLVLHVLDLWPDAVAPSGFLPDASTGRSIGRQTIERAMHGWCGAMYRSAAQVAYISPSVGDLLAGRGVPREKLAYIPMWADETPVSAPGDLRTELGLRDDQIVLVYAGTLGETQGLDVLLDACALVDDPRLVCLIAGSGLAEDRLRTRAKEAGLRSVTFLGRLPRTDMPALMAAGDAHFVSLRPTGMAPYTMPSKVQAILAAGRALLTAVDGDVATVARDSGAGITARPGDVSSIADGIRELCQLGREKLHLLGRAGRDYYRREFSLATGVRRVEAALHAAVIGGRR